MPKNERRNVTYIDPLFNNPPNVKDLAHGAPEASGGALIMGPGDTYHDIPTTSIPNTTVSWTNSLVVASQTIRTSLTGVHTVEVVLDLPDEVGVTNYNVRLNPR
jgi:hypothetical protein